MDPGNLLAENARIQLQLDDTEAELNDVRKERDVFREELSRNRAHVARLTSLAEAQESKVRDLERQLERMQRVQRKLEVPVRNATVEERQSKVNHNLRENDIKQEISDETVDVEIFENPLITERNASFQEPAPSTPTSKDLTSVFHSSTPPFAKDAVLARKEVNGHITDLPGSKRPLESPVDSDQRQIKRRKAEFPDHGANSAISVQNIPSSPPSIIPQSPALLFHRDTSQPTTPMARSNAEPLITPPFTKHNISLAMPNTSNSASQRISSWRTVTQKEAHTDASNTPFTRTANAHFSDGTLSPGDTAAGRLPRKPIPHALKAVEATPDIISPSSDQVLPLSMPQNVLVLSIIDRPGHQRPQHDHQSHASSSNSTSSLLTRAQSLAERLHLEPMPTPPEAADAAARFLHATPSFNISHPITLPLWPSRTMLSDWYGGIPQNISFKLVKGGRAHIFLSAECCTALPKAMGDPAVVVLAHPLQGSFESAVFLRVGSDDRWVYGGQYQCKVRPMTSGEFQRLPSEFKVRFAQDIRRWKGRAAGVTANILRRKLGALYSPGQHESAPGRFLEVEDIIGVVESGEEVVWIGFLKCIGYDHAFASELERLMREHPQTGSGASARAPGGRTRRER
ncbi:hypothetical protein Hypma_001613 [Hypsizygus marmoreus]|uniref:DUF6697 domain-containing protein n=1 Tax=Hypsizygus marmoreus TaxID=39966 RepID=A0A369J662_HYPMA|nr:hypothetical protein Hypma_001613 [Hypsizygus marmoreus]